MFTFVDCYWLSQFGWEAGSSFHSALVRIANPEFIYIKSLGTLVEGNENFAVVI